MTARPVVLTDDERAVVDSLMHDWMMRDVVAGRPQALDNIRTAHRSGGDAPGPRCGTCAHREIQSYHNKTYPKCVFGEGIRVTGCESSDVRAWWPACRDYEKDGTP